MLDKQKLEKLLLLNWSEFLDIKKLFKIVAEASVSLPNSKTKVNSNQIKLSNLQITKNGFKIWLEFQFDNKIGTLEMLTDFHGNYVILNII